MDYLRTLNRSDLEKMGITDWPYGFADRVRFNELDALNHVNNVVFLTWFETARVRYIQDYGLTSYSGTDDDPQIVIRAQSVNYFAPMYQNEDYVITAQTQLIKPSSTVMKYAVYVDGQVRADGSAVVISLEKDGKTRRPHKAEAMRAMIERDGAKTEGV